jgi:hypothetical protein
MRKNGRIARSSALEGGGWPLRSDPCRNCVIRLSFISCIRLPSFEYPCVMTVAEPMPRIRLAFASMLLASTVAVAQSPPVAPAPQGGASQGGDRGAARDGGNGGGRGNRDGGGRAGRGMFGGFGGGGGGGGRMFGPMGRSLDSVTELREQFQPFVLKRDVPLMRDQLRLDDGQVTVVETLVGDYETQFNEASEKAQQAQRDAMQKMFQSFMGGGAREKFQDAFQKIQADLEQMAVEAGGELPPETRRQYFRDQMQKMTEDMQKEREASGAAAETRQIASEMAQAAERWRRQRAEMDAHLLEGVRATLRPPQAGTWDAFDRFLRREKTLSRGRLSGESVNLFAVVDESGIPKESVAKLGTLLDEYEVRLDEALKRRNEYLAQNEAKALKAITEGDAKAMEQLADRMIDLRNGVRRVNEESRAAIVAALPADEGKKVEKAALEAAYGRVYRATRADRAFKAALDLPDLSPDARKAITELQAAYALEIDAMNQRIAQTIRKSEPEQMKQEAVRAAGLLNGGGRFFDGPPQDATDALFEKRGDMGDGYVKRLTALLTPEQADKLPKGSGRDDGRRQGPFGSWTIAEMPEEVRAAAKAADKDGNGVLEGEERRQFQSMRPPDGGPGGPGGDQPQQGGGRRNRGNQPG